MATIKSIEEKAKAYDDLLVKLQEAKVDNNVCDERYCCVIDDIIPELKESEDNIIIKALKSGFKILEREYNLKGLGGIKFEKILAWLEKQVEQKPNPYSGTSFEYNGHTWGMCARDNGVEILIDGHLDRVFTVDSNAKEMFIKALERVEEQNAKGYKLTDCDKNSWWEDFKAYTYCTIEQKTADNVEPKFHEGDMIIHKELGGDYIHNPHKIIQVDILDKKYRLEGGLVAHFGEQDDYELVEQKPAWSEEDENMLENTIGLIEVLDRETKGAFITKEYIDFLKSLKERYTWRPSDNELEVLRLAAEKDGACLMGLYEQLKKLKS